MRKGPKRTPKNARATKAVVKDLKVKDARGISGGKANFDDIKVTKYLDKSSPLIQVVVETLTPK